MFIAYDILFQALLKYVEYIQDALYAPSSLKVTYEGLDNTTMIGKSQYMQESLCLAVFLVFSVFHCV